MAVLAAGVLAAILLGTDEGLLLRKAQPCEWRGIETQIRNKIFKTKKKHYLAVRTLQADMLRPDMSVGISSCGGEWLQFSHHQHIHSWSPMAARPNGSVCVCSLAGTAGSNPAIGLDICALWFLCLARQRGLCDGLVARPEESYQVLCIWVWSRNLINEV